MKGEISMKKTIKEWELETGIKIKKSNGFLKGGGKRNKIYSDKFTDRSFKRCVKNSIIAIKTEKGVEFLNKKI